MNVGALGLLAPLLGRFGWRAILLVALALLAFQYFGQCPGTTTAPYQGAAPETSEPGTAVETAEDELTRFTGFVFDDVQTNWQEDFGARGERYAPARIVVYRQAVSSECGTTSSAVGPFYCPLDRKVYIDMSFYEELRRRFGAPGDFAQAYVIGHEVGHHVQNLAGTLESGTSRESVQVELQADCLAGVWARDAERRGLLEIGDLEEALGAAAAIGDDRIQAQTTGQIREESFTHGSSEQRVAAFRRGYQGGEMRACGI